MCLAPRGILERGDLSPLSAGDLSPSNHSRAWDLSDNRALNAPGLTDKSASPKSGDKSPHSKITALNTYGRRPARASRPCHPRQTDTVLGALMHTRFAPSRGSALRFMGSGAHPSPGAASSEEALRLEACRTPNTTEVAATGDGRAPLNRCERRAPAVFQRAARRGCHVVSINSSVPAMSSQA